MLSERQLEAVLKVFEQRTQALTDTYLRKVGEHIKDIGQMTPADVNRLVELKRMGANVDRMKTEIAQAMGVAAKDVEKVFYTIAETDYRFAAKFYGEGRQIPIKQNLALKRILQAQLKQTADELINLSNTTVLSGAYKSAVDKAVQAVQSGMTDYNAAIRRTIKDAACEGLRVHYASGYERRLDSAVRMNVLDGARQLNQDVARQTGKEFGADGVELSAHALCAEDHLPYQGKQFSNKDYESLQAMLERPIGQWNCKHFAFPILLGISRPAYTDEELMLYRINSEQPITIGDVTKSRYEWSQEQRRLETAVRRQKDVANMAKASGDDVLRRNAQANINALQKQYEKVSNAAGLYEQRDKMSVAGFRRVKALDELTDATRFRGAVFETEKAYARHVSKHLTEYGKISEAEYVVKAERVLRSAPSDDILSLTRSDGSVAKYRISTNEFVVGTKDGKIRTAFKPKDGIRYWWDKEVSRNG